MRKLAAHLSDMRASAKWGSTLAVAYGREGARACNVHRSRRMGACATRARALLGLGVSSKSSSLRVGDASQDTTAPIFATCGAGRPEQLMCQHALPRTPRLHGCCYEATPRDASPDKPAQRYRRMPNDADCPARLPPSEALPLTEMGQNSLLAVRAPTRIVGHRLREVCKCKVDDRRPHKQIPPHGWACRHNGSQWVVEMGKQWP